MSETITSSMRLSERRQIFDATTKGFPSVTRPIGLDEVGKCGWNVLREEVPLPCAVLKDSALQANIARMQALLEQYGLALCPHGKTTLSPQLMRRQLDAGAWGVTAATSTHVATYRLLGFGRVLLANQLVGRQAVRTVAQLLNVDPAFEFYCLVDSVASVRHLLHWLPQYIDPARRLNVLLELGMANGRTGARSLPEAMEIARTVAANSGTLSLAGAECYEGTVPGEPSEAGEQRIRALFSALRDVALCCEQENLFNDQRVVLSAGGSAYVDLAAEALAAVPIKRAVRLLRSGCYLTHDDGWLQRHQLRAHERTQSMVALPTSQAAIEIWAYVQSVPEPGQAIVNFGKRDASYDIDLPIPRRWFRPGLHSEPQPLGEGYRVTGLNDQHAYLSTPIAEGMLVGDMICFGISHPCTTFDKWRLLYVVDDHYTILEAVTTAF